ncbi:LysR family transcriptional regulator [Robiginitomaculum antarcticum]|uniref:LysR family transcriptional regulator n=1 Tax=Robiginitomaculum antarcticum TaxID=437507 RepID=UPI0004771DDD|nr:LysR family transcriptional regulator [Robiginitomaculum antarcticum]
MSLRHIEVFCAVYQAGSVSGAARHLNVSQPSVSKVLRHAESRIGFTLFKVVKGRLAPTDEAHILYNEARDVYSRIHSLNETAKNIGRGNDGHIRIAVLPSLGLEVAPSTVAAFLRKFPNVTFDIKTMHNEDMLRSLYERHSDIGIVYDAPLHPRLTYKKIGKAELVLLYRKSELPDLPKEVSMDMIGARKIIRLTDEGTVGNLVNVQLGTNLDMTSNITVQTYYIAAALVRHGAGLAIVDEFTARANLSEDLDFRPFKKRVQYEIYCIHLDDRPMSKLSKEFTKIMKRTLSSISFS